MLPGAFRLLKGRELSTRRLRHSVRWSPWQRKEKPVNLFKSKTSGAVLPKTPRKTHTERALDSRLKLILRVFSCHSSPPHVCSSICTSSVALFALSSSGTRTLVALVALGTTLLFQTAFPFAPSCRGSALSFAPCSGRAHSRYRLCFERVLLCCRPN